MGVYKQRRHVLQTEDRLGKFYTCTLTVMMLKCELQNRIEVWLGGSEDCADDPRPGPAN
jgi:hypothetical protein